MRPRDLPSLEVMRAFVVFADTLNLSEAARRLHLSQPALHSRIAGLGTRLGVALYVRRGAAIELTRAGAELARFARSLLERTERGLQAIRGDGGSEQVVLAAGAGAYLYLLGPVLQAFAAQSPARLRLVTANQSESVTAVRRGEADLAVTPLGGSVTGLECVSLRTFGQVLVVPKAHALAKKRKIALEELRGVPLVLPPRGRAHRDRIAAAFPEGEGAIDVVAEADGWHLMLEFAARGLGAAIVNDYCRLPDGLVGVPVPQLPTQSLFACRRADEAHRGEAAEALWSRLPKALRART